MEQRMFETATLADLPAFGIAHETNVEAGTGCTVVVAPAGATCGVDVRGGGPATRETDLLRPDNMIELVHAVVISGGSAFGLAASTGVMEALGAESIGFGVGDARVPIVVQACLFDLLVGENTHPGPASGAAAARAALALQREGMTGDLAQGCVGAGCGATVGKLLGPERIMKGGFGWSAIRAGDLVVASLVAVNACGNVRDRAGDWIAGCRDDHGNVVPPMQAMEMAFAAQAAAQAASRTDEDGAPCTNTTLGVVLTNAALTKAQATKVSTMAHDAYARAIEPVHTMNDGDTIFTFASGPVATDTNLVGALACETMQDAIVNAVLQATDAYGIPAAR